MTYEYDHLGNDLNILEEILSEKNAFSKKLINAKKPMLIIGQAILNRHDSLKVFSILEQIIDKYKISSNGWNGVNTLQISASRVGALDMGLYQKTKSLSDICEDAKNGKTKLLISFGADEVNYSDFKECNIIYIGTHGDCGANNADIILPAAAYTEKDAIYINTEGRLQYANKANFPPNEAREDWKIVNQISEILSLEWGIITLGDVRDLIKKEFSLLFEGSNNSVMEYCKLLANKPKDLSFNESLISPIIKDFYISNTISRFSKTMSECSRARQELRRRA
jgi:NADH-quinone oxidoreductase subunit G